VFGLGRATRIYLAAGATDMRKGFEGLYGLVRDRLLCDPAEWALVPILQCPAQSVESPRLERNRTVQPVYRKPTISSLNPRRSVIRGIVGMAVVF
jgi:hypothetical protein